MMPPKRNQQNKDKMEEIRKSLYGGGNKLSGKTTNTFCTGQSRYKLISTPDPDPKEK